MAIFIRHAELTAFAFVIASSAFPQAGSLDPSFGTNGAFILPATNGHEVVVDVVSLADRSMVIMGSADNGTNSDVRLLKLLENGTVDDSFGTNGSVTVSFGDGEDSPSAMIQDAEGGFLICGRSEDAAGDEYMFLSRFTPNGFLDLGFGDGDGYAVVNDHTNERETARALTTTSDGRIVVVGDGGVSANTEPYILRYLPDGTPDPDFASDGKLILTVGTLADEELYAVHVDVDGNITCGGTGKVNNDASNKDATIYRIDASGTPINAFGSDGVVTIGFQANLNDAVQALWVDDDVKIACSVGSSSYGMARYSTSGVLVGAVIYDHGLDELGGWSRQSDGRFLYCGRSDTETGMHGAVRRLTSGGLADQSLSFDPLAIDGVPNEMRTISLQNDNKVLVAGYAALDNASWMVARFLNDFGVGVPANEAARVLHMQPNPANDQLHIDHPAAFGNATPVEVFDATGRSVRITSISRARDRGTLDVRDLAPGIYHLRIGEGSLVRTATFMISR